MFDRVREFIRIMGHREPPEIKQGRVGTSSHHQFHDDPYTGANRWDESNETLREYSRRLWGELPVGEANKVINYIEDDEDFMEGAMPVIRQAIAADPENWLAPYHFGWGMAFRNFLRGCLADAELPTGNWDDYYAAAVEEVVRNNPGSWEPKVGDKIWLVAADGHVLPQVLEGKVPCLAWVFDRALTDPDLWLVEATDKRIGVQVHRDQIQELPS